MFSLAFATSPAAFGNDRQQFADWVTGVQNPLNEVAINDLWSPLLAALIEPREDLHVATTIRPQCTNAKGFDRLITKFSYGTRSVMAVMVQSKVFSSQQRKLMLLDDHEFVV